MHWYSLERAIFVKFSQLILRKIIKTVAHGCLILRLKCTKLYFGLGCAPAPARELTALPRIHSGLLLRGGERKEGRSPCYFFLRIYAHGLVGCMGIMLLQQIGSWNYLDKYE